jgi:hypothetical protein
MLPLQVVLACLSDLALTPLPIFLGDNIYLSETLSKQNHLDGFLSYCQAIDIFLLIFKGLIFNINVEIITCSIRYNTYFPLQIKIYIFIFNTSKLLR